MDSTADFGVGIGSYFVDIQLIGVTFLLCGFIVAPVIHYYSQNFSAAGGNTWATAICTYSNVTVFTNPGQPNSTTSTAVIAENCVINDTMVICDIVMCFFFIGVIIMNMKLQNKVVEKLDSQIQSVQDYSLVVTDPDADAVHPDEWQKFFSRFGTVRYVSISKYNNKLIELLLKKKVLLSKLKNAIYRENGYKMPPIQVDQILKHTADPAKGDEEDFFHYSKTVIKKENLDTAIEWDEEHMDRHVCNIDKLYLKPSDVEVYKISCCQKVASVLPGLDGGTQKGLTIQLKLLEEELEKAYLETYRANRVYVTFEKEEEQRLALDT